MRENVTRIKIRIKTFQQYAAESICLTSLIPRKIENTTSNRSLQFSLIR